MAGDGQPERAQDEALVDVLGDLLLLRPEVAAEGSTHPRLTIRYRASSGLTSRVLGVSAGDRAGNGQAD